MSSTTGARNIRPGDPPNDGYGSDSPGRGKLKNQDQSDDSSVDEEEEKDQDNLEGDQTDDTHPSSDERKKMKEQRRLEINRLKARERRKRKKETWHEMQENLVELSQENTELRQRHELLTSELSRIRQARGNSEPESSSQLGALSQAEQTGTQHIYLQQPGGIAVPSPASSHQPFTSATSSNTAPLVTMTDASLSSAPPAHDTRSMGAHALRSPVVSAGATQSAHTNTTAQLQGNILGVSAAARSAHRIPVAQLQGNVLTQETTLASIAAAGSGHSNVTAQTHSPNGQALLSALLLEGQQQQAAALGVQGNTRATDERGLQLLRETLQRQQLLHYLAQQGIGSPDQDDEKTEHEQR